MEARNFVGEKEREPSPEGPKQRERTHPKIEVGQQSIKPYREKKQGKQPRNTMGHQAHDPSLP